MYIKGLNFYNYSIVNIKGLIFLYKYMYKGINFYI